MGIGQAGAKHEHLNLKADPTGKWNQSGSGLPAELSGKRESLQLHYHEVVPDPWQQEFLEGGRPQGRYTLMY